MLFGCSQAIHSQKYYLDYYHAGQLKEASTLVDEVIECQIPHTNYFLSKDAVWLLLDRATIAFAEGNLPQALLCYQKALEAIDFYSQKSSLENLEQILLQDDCKAYSGQDYEQILARVYFALALLQNNDYSNAYAILRQAEEVQQFKNEIRRNTPLCSEFSYLSNPVAKYLLALISEKKGDYSNAKILYRECQELLNNSSIDKEFFNPSLASQGTLIFIGHNGNTPYKVTTTADGSLASAAALETFLACHQIDPACSTFTGIPIPLLLQKTTSLPTPLFARIQDKTFNLEPFYDIRNVAYQENQQQIPFIIGRGIARMVLRRSTVLCAQEQDPCFGAFADMAMLIMNTNTPADLRTWGTLPSRIDLCRLNLAPGIYSLELISPRLIPPMNNHWTIEIKANQFYTINIFNIHPNVATILLSKNLIRK